MFFKKVILLIVSLLFLIPSHISIQAAGADKIFYEVGMEKPDHWDNWSRERKHEYFRSLGLYPENGNKYKGKVGDLSDFFSKFGAEQPANWDKMSFKEKNEFLFPPSHLDEVINDKEVSSINFNKRLNDVHVYWFIFGFIIIVVLSYFRQTASPFIYYLLPSFLLWLSVHIPEKYIFNLFGVISEVLLIFLLFIKPLAVIFSSKFLFKLVSFRRQLGVACFWFFIFHALGLFVIKGLNTSSLYSSPSLFFGSIAGFLVLILAITSNNFSVKILQKNWKRLQYLAYPALFATLAHVSLVQYGNLNKVLVIFGVFGLLKLGEWRIYSRKGKS